ncbi:hypothetical protein EVAR_82077_1 [Eumeta japonica]|uniref:Uncharacterized protein n=1 Tax=Eumeta variegata TaxID=151549 RepID=A0A4C1U2B9_EUMVA|nr:hypothetical protein EVAR_82077_1 [Eumeta japonica]
MIDRPTDACIGSMHALGVHACASTVLPHHVHLHLVRVTSGSKKGVLLKTKLPKPDARYSLLRTSTLCRTYWFRG